MDLDTGNKSGEREFLIEFFKFPELLFQIDEDAGAGEADVGKGVVPTQSLEEIQTARTDEIRGVMKELAGRHRAGFSEDL